MEPTVKSFEVVESLEGIGSKAKVCYQVNSLPWPLMDWDVVALWYGHSDTHTHRTMFEENDSYHFVSTSVVHPYKPETSECICATLILGSYLLEPSDGGTEVGITFLLGPQQQHFLHTATTLGGTTDPHQSKW